MILGQATPPLIIPPKVIRAQVDHRLVTGVTAGPLRSALRSAS